MKIESVADHPEHLDTLVEWHRREWGSEWADQVRESNCRDTIPTAYLALEGRELLGSVLLVVHDMTTREELTPWMGGVYVDGAHRGRGIATRLVIHAMDAALRMGVASLWLYTASSRKLYENLGWSFAEHTQYEGEPVTLMQIALK